MDNIYEEQAFLKTNKNLSKNNIIKKVNNIKSVKNYFSKNHKLKRNKDGLNLFSPKKNLTCSNLFNNYKDINIKKINSSTRKLKQDKFYNSEYSSFFSRNSKLFNSDYALTRLCSPNIIQTEIRYRKIFSCKSSKNKFSQNRPKSSTTNNTKSNKYYSSFSSKKTNIKLISPKKSKSNIFYNQKLYNSILKNSFSKYRRENLSAFMEKTRIIRKEKIINLELKNKIQSEIEINKEKINLVNNSQDEIYKKYSLLNNFDNSFNNYLRYLKTEELRESQISLDFKKRKLQLQIINDNIQKKINRLKKNEEKYKNIKKLLILIKNDYKTLTNKDKDKYKVNDLIKTENLEHKENKNNKKRYSKLFNQIFLINFKKENIKINKKENNFNNNNIKRNSRIIKSTSINLEKTENLLNKNTKKIIDDKKSNINNELYLNNDIKDKSIFDDELELNQLFINLNNILLKDFNYLNEHKRYINDLKIKLAQMEKYKSCEDEKIINSKIKMLDFIKKENIRLENKIKLIQNKISNKEKFKNNLENKLIIILININKEINIPKIVEIKDLFYILKMDPYEFLNKIHISKILYMIKIIEFIILFLNDLMHRYLNDKKFKELFKDILTKLEKEKKMKSQELFKQQVNQNLEEKKIKALKKAEKIRFFSSKKIYYKNNNCKIASSYKKSKLLKRNSSNNTFQLWLSYN